jgi:uncharacterized protein YcbK (DUF882 family)
MKYFQLSEFACKCGCGYNVIDFALVHELDEIRRIYGRPMIIASGCRCAKHNEAEGGVSESAHTKGLAVDIECKNSRDRYDMLLPLLSRFFRVGIGKTFIHIDVDTTKDQDVAWLY